MATIYGNTFSDLQSGANTALGLDVQRANAQDAINARRLEAFLRLAGQREQTRAQQAELASNRAQRMAELTQQINANRDIAQMDRESRAEVARIAADARGSDPRFYQSLAEIQALNNENQSKVNYARQLSNARKAAVMERDRIKANQKWFLPYFRGSSGGALDFGDPDDPRWTELNAVIPKLDAQAATLGLALAQDGGYVVPEYNPIALPDFGRTTTRVLPNSTPVSETPALLNTGPSFELVPGGAFDRLINPVPVSPMFQVAPSAPSAPVARPKLRFDANTMDFVP